MEIVQKNFRPEFVNRIDDIVVFHPLGTPQIRAIVEIQLGYLRARLLERDMGLSLDDAARDHIGEAGFRRILRHPKLRKKPFILETPVDEEGDDRRNVDALKRLAAKPVRNTLIAASIIRF